MNCFSALLFIFLSLFLHSFGVVHAEETLDVKGEEMDTDSESSEESAQAWSVESTTRSQFVHPSHSGQAGMFRIRSAESLPEGALTFGLAGEYYWVSDAPELGAGSRTANSIAENLFIGYSPWDRVTLSLMRRNSSTTFGTPRQLISSLGDMNFSAQYSLPLNQSHSLALAPIANFLVASDFNNLSPAGNTISLGGGLALSHSLYWSLKLPVFLHANLLYHTPQIRGSAPAILAPETFFSFSRFNTFTWGLGAEYAVGDFIPFVEYQQVIHSDSGLSLDSMPSKVSLGTRITPLENKSLSLLVGTDIAIARGLTVGVPFSPTYQIIGQLAYTVGLSTTERKHYFTTKDVGIIDRKFNIKRNINFKVNSAELELQSRDLLDQIARVIKENRIKKLLIVGHTDSTAGEEYNHKLSLDRANSVRKYLSSQGISGARLLTQGYGRRKPRASNLTETGRQINRRVEFYILE